MLLLPSARTELATLLSAHANAEEAVIYPHSSILADKTHGTAGYTEQAARRRTGRTGVSGSSEPAVWIASVYPRRCRASRL